MRRWTEAFERHAERGNPGLLRHGNNERLLAAICEPFPL